jgi:hypothetical protein
LEGDEFLSGIEYWVELHRRIDRKKVCKETSSVRGSHGGSRQCGSGGSATSEGGENVQTRGENVNASPVVGEVGAFITESGGANGHRPL